MLEKIQVFNAQNNDLPLKAAGAFVGAAVGAFLVVIALNLIEADLEDAFVSYEPIESVEAPVE